MNVGSDSMEDQVEKSSAMIGGIGEKSIEEAKGMLKELFFFTLISSIMSILWKATGVSLV